MNMSAARRLLSQRQGMPAMRRRIGGLVEQTRSSGSPVSAPSTEPSALTGQIAWVVGGVGVVGRGICRGLLKAGATVIVSSNSQARLDVLHEDMGSHANLIGVKGTMRPSGAQELVSQVMEMTSLRLNHVVAHCGVRWWRNLREGERGLESELGLGRAGQGLDEDPKEFAERAAQLPVLHYTAAQLLLPRLEDIPGSSYTFVTGGAGEQRSIEAQVNAHGVWGLAAALRAQYASSPVRVSELRVNVPIDRPAAVRAEDPRERPLSVDLGELCAGLVASPSADVQGLHKFDTLEEVDLLRAKLPCPAVVDGLPAVWKE